MPLPLAPIATTALRMGAMAVLVYAVRSLREPLHRDQRAEDAMDDLGEGVAFRRDDEQVNGAARLKRVVRVGQSGPGIEIDASALGRLRLRRV